MSRLRVVLFLISYLFPAMKRCLHIILFFPDFSCISCYEKLPSHCPFLSLFPAYFLLWRAAHPESYIRMLIYGSGNMDLAEERETWSCWDINTNTFILQGPWGSCMLTHESETWTLQRILETWILQRFLLQYTWMLGHQSEPETWNLQRILRYKDAQT